jgi:stage V sporulation protein G
MEVTSVKVIKSEKGRMKAFASIVLNGSLAIHGIRVIQTDEKLFVAMPSKRDNNDVFHDIVHPINSDLRKKIEQAVIVEYNSQMVTV